MKARVQVLSSEVKQGVGKKSGQAYRMDVCQCVVHGEKIEVGELVLPRDHPPVAPGMYEAEFVISVDYDKRIAGRLVRLVPVAAVAVDPKRAAA